MRGSEGGEEVRDLKSRESEKTRKRRGGGKGGDLNPKKGWE